MIKIDAHQHYWKPNRGDYDWMPKDNPILHRNYSPDDLAPHLAEHGIEKTVLVQAAATVAETEYLLEIADATDSVAGVVGWVNFDDPTHIRHLKRLALHPKFLGVRPMIQDIADVNWMLRGDVQWGFQAICDLDLTFDALGLPHHLSNFLTLLKRYPDMRTVIDHCMKPQIRDHKDRPELFIEWAEGMSRLAGETNAYCKLSGLVTEAQDGWGIEDIRPSSDHVLDIFGADRVMWGSDWPVCQLQASYDHWIDVTKELTARLNPGEISSLHGATAIEFYQLSV